MPNKFQSSNEQAMCWTDDLSNYASPASNGRAWWHRQCECRGQPFVQQYKHWIWEQYTV